MAAAAMVQARKLAEHQALIPGKLGASTRRRKKRASPVLRHLESADLNDEAPSNARHALTQLQHNSASPETARERSIIKVIQ